MKSSLQAKLKFLIGWPLSLVALFFLVKSILPQGKQIITSLHHMQIPLLIYALISFFLYYFLRSYAWHTLIKAKGHKVSLKESSFLWSISEIKRYIPGNIWSFLGRTVSFSEIGIPKKEVGQMLLFEAEAIFLSSILVSGFSIPFLMQSFFPDFPQKGLIQLLFVFLAVLAVGGFLFQNAVAKRLPHMLRKLALFLSGDVSSLESAKILLLTVGAFLCFGLGYYFAISSIIFLNPALIFSLIGFFVFTLLVGLLSIVTPTGLGVREGAIALGLQKITPVALASFAALFARIILILTELLFIASMTVWHKSKSSFLRREEEWIASHKQEVLLFCLIAAFFSYFTVINFLRYDQFYTGRFDLGNMVQTVWNTLHGRVFQMTDPNGTATISRLAFHADFILIFLTPFYAIWQNPKMLLLIQTAVMSGGALFVYLLAQLILKNKNIALAFAFAFLLNPSVQRVTIYDFHAVALATTFFLGALYFLLKKQYWVFLVFALLAAITKEQVWVIVALLGLYIAIKQKKVVLGAILSFVSVCIFYLLIWRIIPGVLGAKHFALSYFNEGGESPSALIKHFLFSPLEAIQTTLKHDRLSYLLQLFLPVGFLSLAAPLFLIFLLPDLALNILSDKPELHQIYYQYTSLLTPFIFVSAMYGVKRVQHHFPLMKQIVFVSILIFFTLISAYLYGPLPGAKNPNLDMITLPNPQKEILDYQIQRIPASASVTATNNIASHLSQREHIYVMPYGVEKADYILLQKKDLANPEDAKKYTGMLMEYALTKNYITLHNDNDLIILRRSHF